jgi:hypothetical protein
MQGDTASANVEAVESFLEDLVTIMNDSGYIKRQTVIVKKQRYFGRCHLGFPQLERNQCLDSKDRLTPSLGANIAGDFKLKPMPMDHSEKT